MDTTTLHTLTEDLASFLSEVTLGDLPQPLPSGSGDLGDLVLLILEQNLLVASTVSGEEIPHGQWPRLPSRASLAGCVDASGGGFDVAYRATAALVVGAFASVEDDLAAEPTSERGVDLTTLYATQVRTTLDHLKAVANALGLPYEPPAEAALLEGRRL